MNDDYSDGGKNHERIFCPNCDSGNTVPVWKNVTEFKRGRAPDYIGCIDCNEMQDAKDYSGWVETETKVPNTDRS